MCKTKRIIGLLLLLVVVFSVGCSNKENVANEETTETEVTEEVTEEATEVAKEPTSLFVSRWAGPHADTQKEIIKDYADSMVTMDDVDYGNLKQKQILSFQSKPGDGNYDVVWVNYFWMKEYVENGYLLPIDDYIKESGLDTSMYSKSMMDSCVIDSKTYGLPTFAQTLILTYDSVALENAGLEVPKTTDDLIAVAKYFKETEGTGIALPAKQGGASTQVYAQILFGTGGYYFNEEGMIDFTSEESIYAAKAYDELAKYSLDGSLAWHHDDVAEAVRTGLAPIGITMSALANLNADPDQSRIVDTVKYAPLPGKNGDVVGNNQFWVWAIAKNTEKPQESFDFIKWFTSPEIEKSQTLINQQVSGITALSEDAEVKEAAPFIAVVMEALSSAKMDPVLKETQTMKDALIATLSEIASTDVDPEEAMKKLQETLKDVDFSDYK